MWLASSPPLTSTAAKLTIAAERSRRARQAWKNSAAQISGKRSRGKTRLFTFASPGGSQVAIPAMTTSAARRVHGPASSTRHASCARECVRAGAVKALARSEFGIKVGFSCERHAPRAPRLRALSCEGQAPRAPPLRAPLRHHILEGRPGAFAWRFGVADVEEAGDAVVAGQA